MQVRWSGGAYSTFPSSGTVKRYRDKTDVFRGAQTLDAKGATGFAERIEPVLQPHAKSPAVTSDSSKPSPLMVHWRTHATEPGVSFSLQGHSILQEGITIVSFNNCGHEDRINLLRSSFFALSIFFLLSMSLIAQDTLIGVPGTQVATEETPAAAVNTDALRKAAQNPVASLIRRTGTSASLRTTASRM
jgi:hypothetical protein